MAYKVRVDSFTEDNIRERSQLGTAPQPGSNSINLVSTQGFKGDDIIYVGTLSREGCEKAVVASVDNATTLTLTDPLKLAHSAYEPVTSVLGDKVRVYRAVNVNDAPPALEAFTVVATREIDPDQPSTYYQDSAGSSGYWYRASYYNEATLAETALTEPVRGDDYSHYASLKAIRREAGFERAANLNDSVVAEQRRQAESEINAALSNVYKVPFDPVPEVVRTLTIKLAAAHLLVNAYGNVQPYSARLTSVREDLKLYASNEAAIVDADGISSAASGVSSYFGEEDRMFRIGDLW